MFQFRFRYRIIVIGNLRSIFVQSLKMDPLFNSSTLPDDTVSCILCHAVISWDKKDKSKYNKHMRYDHGAFFNINLMLVLNVMDKSKLWKLIEAIKKNKEDDKNRVETEVQTDLLGTEIDQHIIERANDELNKMVSQIDPDTSDISLDLDDSLMNTSTDQDESHYDDPEVKQEIFTSPDPNLEAIELSLEDVEEEFDILNITNDDNVLTAGGVVPLTDYKTFNPSSIVPSGYDPSGHSRLSQDQEDIKEKTKKIDEFLIQTTDYFKKGKEVMSSASASRASKFTVVDPSLPEGWRARCTERRNGRKDWEFMSPELKVIRSRVGVVEYLRAMGGYSDEEIFRVCPAMRIKSEKQ